MRIPRLAFALMLSAIILLSSGLVLVRARAGAATGSVLELLFQAPPRGRIAQCVITADGNRNSNHCNFSTGDDSGVLFLNARFIATNRDRVQVGIKAKYEFRATGGGASDSEAELREVPEQLVFLEPEEKKEITVSGLGAVGLQGKYLDHIPALLYRPEETLDPQRDEFRVVSPVLIRDKGVLANHAGSSSIDNARDATLMFYVPGEGRYLISVVPFGGSVEGDVQLGQIRFTLNGHDYLLLTSMPCTRSKHVWVKHEPEFKPSEHGVHESDARDDRPMFIVRSLKKLEESNLGEAIHW